MTVSNTTMSNTQRVQHIYGLFGAGDIPGVINSCSSDVQWDSRMNPMQKQGKLYIGKQGVGSFFSDLRESAQITKFVPMSFFEDGNDVYVHGWFEYTSLTNNAVYLTHWAMRFSFNDGAVCGFCEYFDTPVQQ